MIAAVFYHNFGHPGSRTVVGGHDVPVCAGAHYGQKITVIDGGHAAIDCQKIAALTNRPDHIGDHQILA